jgi:hypothetical protein
MLRPQLGSAEYIGPRVATVFTSEKLNQALKEATQMAAKLDAGGKSDGKLTPDAYQAFCRLSEAVTLVNGDVSDAQLTVRIDATTQLLKKIVMASGHAEAIGRFAGERLDAKAAENTGILLAGTVKEILPQKGHLFGLVIQLAGTSKTIDVVSDQDYKANVNDAIAFWGVVVRAPAANLVGYADKKPIVVWSGVAAKVTDHR